MLNFFRKIWPKLSLKANSNKIPEKEKSWTPKFMDVEKEFTAFVCQFRDGCLVSDAISQIPDGFLNADFILRQQQIIIELKCLSKDSHESGLFARRLVSAASKLGYTGSQFFGWTWRGEQIPQEVLRDLRSRKVRGLVDALKKANQQISQTKILLNMPEARGLCMLANDYNYGLSPNDATFAMVRAFESFVECHIDCIVYFTPNVFHDMGDNIAHTLWIPIYDVGSESFGDFVNDFGRSWHKYVDQNVQPSISRREGNDGLALKQAKVIGGFKGLR